jgi:hypothetical protein
MALAALGAATVLGAGLSTADAATSASPFADTYVGAVPGSSGGFWVVTISDGGRITDSYSDSGRAKSSLSGRIGADGSYSVSVSETVSWYDERRNRTNWVTLRWSFAGDAALDAAGDIVGTTDDGGSFVWRRQ